MDADPPEYYAYLLRLWRTGPRGPWRASLEDAKTGERIGFGNLSEVFFYLHSKAGDIGGPVERDEAPRAGPAP